MRHARYSGLYCLKCGAAQVLSAAGRPCPALVKKATCGHSAFTSSVGLVPWDALNDEDAIFLKSIRVSALESAT